MGMRPGRLAVGDRGRDGGVGDLDCKMGVGEVKAGDDVDVVRLVNLGHDTGS